MSGNETVTPSTPQTIEGVTVSEPGGVCNKCAVTFANGFTLSFDPLEVRAMGLVVPEPVVACRIGTAEFTLTREQVGEVADWVLEHGKTGAIRAAARAHLDSEGER